MPREIILQERARKCRVLMTIPSRIQTHTQSQAAQVFLSIVSYFHKMELCYSRNRKKTSCLGHLAEATLVKIGASVACLRLVLIEICMKVRVASLLKRKHFQFSLNFLCVLLAWLAMLWCLLIISLVSLFSTMWIENLCKTTGVHAFGSYA